MRTSSVSIHREACCGCGACGAVCPHGAVTMERDPMGFSYPGIDARCCVGCGRCVGVCPVKAIVKNDE